MSKINGYVTIESIVEKVIRNTDDHQDIDIYDAAEWTAEAMGKIGLRDAYEFKVATIDIEAQKGALPFGCIHIFGVRDADSGRIINKATDNFVIHPSNSSTTTSTTEFDTDDFPTLEDLTVTVQSPTYYINSGFMYCNFSEGSVEIAYTSYPLDERGFPMIPDEAIYKEAIMSYIRFKMDYRLWRKGKLAENIKRDSEQEWCFYCDAAFAKNSLGIDDMENIFKGMVKIASDQNAADYAFKFLGSRNVTNY